MRVSRANTLERPRLAGVIRMVKAWILSRVLSDEDVDSIDINNLKKTTDDNYYEAIKLRAAFKKLNVDVKIVKIQKIDESIILNKELPNIIIMRCMVHNMDELNFIDVLCRKNITVINNMMSQMVSLDKWRHYKILENNNISIPATTAIKIYATEKEIIKAMDSKKISFPIVVKPNGGSRGNGVFKCNNINDIFDCIEKNYTLYPKSKILILQQWIDHRIKGVLSAYAIGGKLIAAQLRIANREMDFLVSNYREDTNRFTYEITDELRKIVEDSCKAIGGIEMTKMDILHDGQKYLVCEINSPGGFIGFDNFFNLDCGMMIAEYALEKYKKDNKLT